MFEFGPPARLTIPNRTWITSKGLDLAHMDNDEGIQPLLAQDYIQGSRELDPLITLFFGRRGDGKTLSATAILYAMRESYRKQGKLFSDANPDGFKLTSNYQVQFAHFNDPHIVDMVSSYDDRMRRMVIAIDEILSYVPSRRSMARANVDFANFLVQIRKLDIEMLATTQRPQNIDSQMLDQIDLFIAPQLFNKRWIPELELWSHKKTGKMQYSPTSVRLEVYDWWGTFTGRQWRKGWPPAMSGELPDWTLDVHNLDTIFPMFHTKEQIPAIWHANRESVLARSWAAGMQEMGEELSPEIVDEEKAGPSTATIFDLVEALPDTVDMGDALTVARQYFPSIQQAQLMEVMGDQGFQFTKKGRNSGIIAQRKEVQDDA